MKALCVATSAIASSSSRSFAPLSFSASSSFPTLLPLKQQLRLSHLAATASSPCLAAAVTPVAASEDALEIFVKASVGDAEKIGDCPFSHRVLLTLEEKGIPYKATYVDLTNKPDWFLDVNPEGKVPVVKFDGKWVPDSDVITGILEEKFPEPSLKTPEDKKPIGSKIFPSFVKFLKSKDPDGSEEALVAELTTFNEYLKDNGPFINGEKITAADLSLAPKLFHMQVALGHYKKWTIPDNLTYLKDYIEALHSRESFLKTKPDHEDVVAGWQKHVL